MPITFWYFLGLHPIYIYIFCMACELHSCPCMRTSRCSHRLVVRHHASTLQARSKCHKIKKLRIDFLWAVAHIQPGHAITEAKCKSSGERTRVFFRFGSLKMPLSISPQQRHNWLNHVAHSAPMRMAAIHCCTTALWVSPPQHQSATAGWSPDERELLHVVEGAGCHSSKRRGARRHRAWPDVRAQLNQNERSLQPKAKCLSGEGSSPHKAAKVQIECGVGCPTVLLQFLVAGALVVLLLVASGT